MIKVISRESPLTQAQVTEFFANYPERAYCVEFVKSIGDKDLQSSLLDSSVPADFFTRELDRAILDGSADVAVNSAKDLPWPLPQGLSVIGLQKSFDSSDSLVSLNGTQLTDLHIGAKVGTSSPSRKEQLHATRPDL